MIPEPVEAVEDVLSSYPPRAREALLAIRRLIYETAAELEVGELTEALRWGEPAYLTEQSKSGSTIRMGWRSSSPDECALYFHCQTTLISDFRSLFDGHLRFEGNRAIILRLGEPLPTGPLEACVGAALTYHRDSKRRLALSKSS